MKPPSERDLLGHTLMGALVVFMIAFVAWFGIQLINLTAQVCK